MYKYEDRGYEETFAELIAGISFEAKSTQVEDLIEFAQSIHTDEMPWVLIPAEDLDNCDDEILPIVFGLLIGEASSEEGEKVRISYNEILEMLKKAKANFSVFDSLSEIIEDDHDELYMSEIEMILTGCGPLLNGYLVYGVTDPQDDSYLETDFDAQYKDTDIDWYAPVNMDQEWIPENGVKGVLAQVVQYDNASIDRVDISEGAHNKRVEQVKDLEGECSYYLLPRYD